MPDRQPASPVARCAPSIPRRLRPAGMAALLAVGALLNAGCGYQIALQPTPTPAGALGVRQIPGQTQAVDPATVIAQIAGGAAGTAASSPAQAAPAVAGSASVPDTGSTAAAAAATAAPVFPRASGGGSSSPVQAPPAVNAAPAASAPPAAPPALPPLAGSPLPSFTATSTPRPTTAPSQPAASATPAATPSAAATRGLNAPVQVYLPQGTNDFLYVGPTQPVDKALASVAGLYDMVWFKPAGAGEQVAYKPGTSPVPLLSTNTLVRIGMKQGASYTMYPPN